MAENKKELHDEELDKASGGLTVNTKLKNEVPTPIRVNVTIEDPVLPDTTPAQNLTISLKDMDMINNEIPDRRIDPNAIDLDSILKEGK